MLAKLVMMLAAFSTVKKQGNNQVLFNTAPFEKIETGDEFWLLTEKNDGVIAKIKAVDLSTSGFATGQITEVGKGFNSQALTKSKLIKATESASELDSLKAGPILVNGAANLRIPGQGIVKGLSRNPTFNLSLAVGSAKLSEVDSFFLENFGAVNSFKSFEIESYIPIFSEKYKISNSFGVDFELSSGKSNRFSMANRKSGNVVNLEAEDLSSKFSLFFRPSFDSSLYSRLGFSFYYLASEKIKIKQQESFAESSGNLEFNRSGPGLKLLWESQPFEGFITQFNYSLGLFQKIVSKGSFSIQGSARQQILGTWVGFRSLLGTLPHAAAVEIKIGGAWKWNAYKFDSQSRSDNGYALMSSFGMGYVL